MRTAKKWKSEVDVPGIPEEMTDVIEVAHLGSHMIPLFKSRDLMYSDCRHRSGVIHNSDLDSDIDRVASTLFSGHVVARRDNSSVIFGGHLNLHAGEYPLQDAGSVDCGVK